MTQVEQHTDDWLPSTEADRKAVFYQLDRLLESPLFRNSKRYPSMLRYVVEKALEGNESLLKERLVGAAVFHRPPDYDTNQDTVVRLTAGEIRKRIAQYYHQPEHAEELRIDLRPGSYVPVFRRSETKAARPSTAAEEILPNQQASVIEGLTQSPAPASTLTDLEKVGFGSWPLPLHVDDLSAKQARAGRSTESERNAASRPSWLRWIAAALTLLLLTCGALFWSVSAQHARTANRQLWDPILQAPGQVHLIIADLTASLNSLPGSGPLQAEGSFDLLRLGEIVNYRDSLAQADLVAFLTTQNKPYTLELSSQASYSDLQRSASVLIGGMDNLWTMRVIGPLRYHFVRRGTSYTYAIEDREHPEQDSWSVDIAAPPGRASEDYALVARIFDVTTGQPVLVAAGLGANGTAAAAEFLVEPKRTAEIAEHAPGNWRHLNMEAVIRTQILDNHAGPPHVVAVYFW